MFEEEGTVNMPMENEHIETDTNINLDKSKSSSRNKSGKSVSKEKEPAIHKYFMCILHILKAYSISVFYRKSY